MLALSLDAILMGGVCLVSIGWYWLDDLLLAYCGKVICGWALYIRVCAFIGVDVYVFDVSLIGLICKSVSSLLFRIECRRADGSGFWRTLGSFLEVDFTGRNLCCHVPLPYLIHPFSTVKASTHHLILHTHLLMIHPSSPTVDCTTLICQILAILSSLMDLSLRSSRISIMIIWSSWISMRNYPLKILTCVSCIMMGLHLDHLSHFSLVKSLRDLFCLFDHASLHLAWLTLSMPLINFRHRFIFLGILSDMNWCSMITSLSLLIGWFSATIVGSTTLITVGEASWIGIVSECLLILRGPSKGYTCFLFMIVYNWVFRCWILTNPGSLLLLFLEMCLNCLWIIKLSIQMFGLSHRSLQRLSRIIVLPSLSYRVEPTAHVAPLKVCSGYRTDVPIFVDCRSKDNTFVEYIL